MRRPGRRRYDHRIRQAIVASGTPRLFPHLRLPPSTARSWIRRGCPPVVSTTENRARTASPEIEADTIDRVREILAAQG